MSLGELPAREPDARTPASAPPQRLLGTACLDAGLSLLSASESFARWLGAAPEALVGRPLSALFPCLAQTGVEQWVRSGGPCRVAPGTSGGMPACDLYVEPVTGGGASPVQFVLVAVEASGEAAEQKGQPLLEPLEAIGQFAGGVAHDLRQPLNVLKLNVQLLRQTGTPRSEIERRQLERLEQHVDQAAQILQDLIAIARDDPPHLAPTDLGKLIDSFYASYALPETVRLQIERPAEGPIAAADDGQIRQVLRNLTRNAAHAMADKPGTLTVAARPIPGGAEIEVRDEGPGIPPELLSRVFEPLFTTRRRGAGLGLTLCRRLVAAHGGEIFLESEEGQGTRAVVRLPAA